MANNIARLLNVSGITLALLLSEIIFAAGDCNLCSPAEQACVTEDQYTFCNEAVPDLEQITNCRTGFVCSTFGSPICQNASNVNTVQDCAGCGTCDVTKTFACLTQYTFALCLGKDTHSDKYTGTCQPDAVCSVNYQYICGTAEDQVVSTCPEEEITTTTTTTTTTTSTTTTTTEAPITPSPSDPSAYCQIIQEEGRFPMGSNLETTCHQFVSCLLVNSIWRGAVYVCPANSYFDSSSKICVTTPPPRCGPRVQSISLLNIQLD